MEKKVIFNCSLVISNVMCYDNCGLGIERKLNNEFNQCIKSSLLPADAEFSMNAEPEGLGLHRLSMVIKSADFMFLGKSETSAYLEVEREKEIANENDKGKELVKEKELVKVTDIKKLQDKRSNINFILASDKTLASRFVKALPPKFKQVSEPKVDEARLNENRYNIVLNISSILVILLLSFFCTPSILLSAGLATISFATTAFTSRDYLSNFLNNLKNKRFWEMSTTVSFGWFFALAHTLFHLSIMPVCGNLSMVFMNFVMPVGLMICVNIMDEIKRFIFDKSKKMQLKETKSLFPDMLNQYQCYQLNPEHINALKEILLGSNQTTDPSNKQGVESSSPSLKIVQSLLEKIDSTSVRKKVSSEVEAFLSGVAPQAISKNLLTAGMLVKVEKNEHFPVDCILVKGNTVVDASILTGELKQNKEVGDQIPAGGVNLGETVFVWTTKNPYQSTVNRLLFRANRARASEKNKQKSQFPSLYTRLIGASLVVAVVVPAVFSMGFSIVVQSIVGVLFSICPCTMAIAQELPQLISLYRRDQKGVHLRDRTLNIPREEVHTIVFDKTGTLTTNNSVVISSTISSEDPLWEKIGLLEKEYGREHPTAEAILRYYNKDVEKSMFKQVENCQIDPEHRGLTAKVQGKMLHLGNKNYLENAGIKIPEVDLVVNQQGLSPTYVAEDNLYKGVIYIGNQLREGVSEALVRLKKEGKKIILLTGDNESSANYFNKQIGSLFDEKNIHAGQSPNNKEEFLKSLFHPELKLQGVCFVGDGLNDAPCCRFVSENKGISYSMNFNDKSAFFTDISLDGSLNYLFHHNKINSFLNQNLLQNKWALIYSPIMSLITFLCFSLVNVAVPPLIPMSLMLSTTLFVLFNSYRVELYIDNELDEKPSWPKKLLASNSSAFLLFLASTLLMTSVLISTVSTGGVSLPFFAFNSGGISMVCSLFSLISCALFGVFSVVVGAFLLPHSNKDAMVKNSPDVTKQLETGSQNLKQFAESDVGNKLKFPVIQASLECPENKVGTRPNERENTFEIGLVASRI